MQFAIGLFYYLFVARYCTAFFLPFSAPRQQRRDVVLHQQKTESTAAESSSSSSSSSLTPIPKSFKHVLAVLSMPTNSMDRIANEAILSTIFGSDDVTCEKVSVYLRCERGVVPTVTSLRRYVGEIYSQLWDVCISRQETALLTDVCVYAQNLPNLAPESWVTIQPDLDGIVSHDSVLGWTSEGAVGRGRRYWRTTGVGGLEEHVQAVNSERKQRNMPPVYAIHVPHWPAAALPDSPVVFLDDEPDSPKQQVDDGDSVFLSGGRSNTKQLYDAVAVGGTFDGLHFGHRKLLTLAVSSVQPRTGKLLVGVTVDAMLTHKEFADFIPKYDERAQGVRDFLHRLAPGMMNRVKIVPLTDAFGPLGVAETASMYDALVLSHETLETGYQLNKHRTKILKLPPVTLLCTRRTEAYGMSSTALRRLRSQEQLQSDSS